MDRIHHISEGVDCFGRGDQTVGETKFGVANTGGAHEHRFEPHFLDASGGVAVECVRRHQHTGFF